MLKESDNIKTKKERLQLEREIGRLEQSFGGIKKMNTLPDAVIVLDVGNEVNAVKEANKLGVPVIGIVDTNNSPDGIDYVIPGNDDSTKSIRIIVDVILDAIQTGLSNRVQAPTKRKDITPVAQEPDFLENEDEPEVTLPEGYDEMDFDDRKKQDDSEVEAEAAEAKEEPKASEAAPSDGEESAEQEAVATKE